jgi:hypothetical protein
MDDDNDDKSIIEKTLEAVKDIAAVASEATHKAMEPEPIKPGDEVVVMPMAAAGFMGEAVMPPFVIIPRRANAPEQISKKAPKTAKKSTKKTAKKSAKKSSKRNKQKAAKRWKPEMEHRTVGGKKKGKKAVTKKRAKKSKR